MRINFKNISFNEVNENGIIVNSLEDFNNFLEIENLTKINFEDNSKRLLLKIISGFYKPSKGNIECSYNNPFYIPEKKYSFPWNTLSDYLKETDKNCKLSPEEISTLVQLEGYENFLPKNKSMGFRLRQILAAAIWRGADLIIADNSFQKLNPADKESFENVIKNISDKCSIDFLIFDKHNYFSEDVFDKILTF